MNKIGKLSFSILLLFICLIKRIAFVCTFKNVAFRKKPIHIMFCTVDHYEPGTQSASMEIEFQRVNDLLSTFPKIVENHRDSAGNIPKRTWFFPPHYHRNGSLKKLVELCARGYGEIEFHLHHGKTEPDTPENLEKTIRKTIEEYSKFGIFGKCNGQIKYGFIHGDWALENSRNNNFCGVNNEIELLIKTGCYADFTFPSCIENNPLKINTIFYVKEDPSKPKSYRRGRSVMDQKRTPGDLMLVQGPIYPYLFFKRKYFPLLKINAAAIDDKFQFSKNRIDVLVKAGIHLKGKNNWIFIKTHTHGALDNKVVLGQKMNKIFSYLETKYNDGKHFVLHYVTAREMYNIINAMEENKTGDNPELYRNYKITPPIYNTSIDILEMSEELKKLVFKTYR